MKSITTPLWVYAPLVSAMLALAIHGGAGKVKDGVQPSESMEEVAYKFTPSFYRTANVTPAYDLNLRRDSGGQMTWIGFYQRSNELLQLRLGYENTWALPYVKVTPSLQYATRGFFGGSLTGEIGERYFGLVGFGRTNPKDYFNLNFDPNDMVMFCTGTRALPNTTLSLFQIRDDRLGTGQRMSHLVVRYKPAEKNRWTVDVSYKEGRAGTDPASVYVQGTGVTLTWDQERYFARVASDPYVNFSNNHMVRVAAGFRF